MIKGSYFKQELKRLIKEQSEHLSVDEICNILLQFFISLADASKEEEGTAKEWMINQFNLYLKLNEEINNEK